MNIINKIIKIATTIISNKYYRIITTILAVIAIINAIGPYHV